jgi:anti-anti-sigma regulatory factor
LTPVLLKKPWSTNLELYVLRERNKDMAKYQHRTFEMYDFRDEAIYALTSKAPRSETGTIAPESWDFSQLAASHSESVTHVEFKRLQAIGNDSAGQLRKDLAQLTDKLVSDSKVLLDFTGVKSFCAASIEALVQFNQNLRHRGSRMVLCCLEPAAKKSFFVTHKT